VLLKAGRVIADTTPVELVSETRGKVWMVTTDPIQAAQLQNKHHVSGLLHYGGEVTLRVISLDRPSEGATPIEPSLEDAYLLKMFS
jgi:ABC-2 type transport system ATP-binding protein